MEKLGRKDLRFIAACLIIVAGGALVTIPLFRRAFPEASIEFRVNRGEARVLAEKFLASRGIAIAGDRFAGRFDIEDEAKVYLERELGLEQASRFYGREAKVWRWEMRWFRSGVKEEERVEITPLGDLAAFESIRGDDAPGPALTQDQARAISRQFLVGRGLASEIIPVETGPVVRPHRTDWRFVDEKTGLRMGQATVRYVTVVSGDRVVGFREFVHVPESWERDYETLRSKNETANLAGNVAMALTFLAMIAVIVGKIVRKDIRWELVAGFGLAAFVLSLLSLLNGLPIALYDYDTASPLSAFVARQLIGVVLGAVGVGAGIALIVAGAEPMYRERFPQHLSLSGIFSARGLRSKRFFRGILLGYAMTAFFFAYQVVFYVIAAKLGAWSPADIKYDNMLSTAFPWATVLFIGFLPAVLEEGSSRLFSISFLDRLGTGRFIAVVLPAFIWGFNHAAYPNQPFYIRAVEVGVAGCAIGLVMLRFGALPLLVWHFTVDALYTALVLLRSGNTYYVVSGAVSSLILLLPLAVSLVLYWKRGGFEPETGLTNGDEGFVPAPPAAAPAPEEVPPVAPVRPAVLAACAIAAAVLAASFLVPPKLEEPLVEDAAGRLRAITIARAFLKVNGIAPEPFRDVAYGGTGPADDEQTRALDPGEVGKLPGYADEDGDYIVRQAGVAGFERVTRSELPPAFWVTRFFRPLQKEEWKVLVDARRARVIGFLNPIDEAAPAPPAPGEPEARRRALDAAERLGYPAKSYSVLEVSTHDRPKRRDTSVVLEAKDAGLGEAKPRLTAVFHGSRMAAFYPSVKVPDSYLREYRSQGVMQPVFLAAKVIAIGSFLGIAMVLFLRLVRAGAVVWKRMAVPMVAAGVLAAAALANGGDTLLRAYPTDQPYSLFLFTRWLLLALGWILVLCAALVGFVLISGARPGWRRALRARGTLGDALLRAAIATVGLVGLEHMGSAVSQRIPALFDADPSLPASLERSIPAVAVLWSACIWTFVVAVAAAVAAVAARSTYFQKGAARALVVVAVLVALMPTSSHSAAEWLGTFLPSALALAWLAICAFLLLRDHAAAWILFGVLASGVPTAMKLLAQPAAEDQVAGAAGVILLLVAAVALLFGRRGSAPEPPPVSPVPFSAEPL